MWLEEKVQSNAVILGNLDTMTVWQKIAIEKLDAFMGPYKKVLEANISSVFLSDQDKSRIIDEFETKNALIIQDILHDTVDQGNAEDRIVENMKEKVREAQQLIKNNPKYQEITQDGDDLDEEDELEDEPEETQDKMSIWWKKWWDKVTYTDTSWKAL